MRLIVDTSVAVAWCARNQATQLSDAAEVAAVTHGCLVPAHFQLELVNTLWRLERAGRLQRRIVDGFLADLPSYGIEYDHEAVEGTADFVLPHARRMGLNAYAAAYLELALREGLPLATRDVALAAAVGAAGATLFTP